MFKDNLKKMFGTRKLVYTALLTALGIVLPLAFHAVPNSGSVFLPMHIPVLLCGIICGFPLGLVCGVLTPVLSSLFNGMPPTPMLPPMICELAVYGAAAALIMRFIPVKNFYVRIYAALGGAMLSGRAVFGILNALFFQAGNYSAKIWLASAFLTAWPGIVIQIIAIPAILIALKKAKLIDFNMGTAPRTEDIAAAENSGEWDKLTPNG